MHNEVQLAERAISWLTTYGDVNDVDVAHSDWELFAANPPTVTVFGAYDSGKSSLLRRLLVDADIPVPSWLTISARHETFEASEIMYREILLKDTPGVSPGSTDARGDRNTATALEAIRATDVLVVVVTSQLLTGERELVVKALDLPWHEGSLWIVISRFDEAGVDPEGDRDGYRQLADAKRRELAEELQRSLSRDPRPRVFVAAPDPYGAVGSDPNPDPSFWDPYRGWDGIAEIASELESLSSSAVELRAAAAQRFWIAKLQGRLTTLTAQEVEAESVARTTSDLSTRVEQLNSRMTELARGARNDLDTAVGIVVDQALTSSILTEEGLKTRLKEALELWLERQEAELAALIDDIESQLAHQVSRPSWQGLRRLIDQLSVNLETDATTNDADGVNLGAYKTSILKLNKDLAKTTSDLKALFESKTTRTRQAATEAAESNAEQLSRAGKLFKGIDAATKVIPFALDAMDLIMKINDDAKEAEAKVQRRTQLERQLDSIKSRAVSENFKAYQSECDKVVSVLGELKASIDALATSLDARRKSYQAAREEASAILESSFTPA